MPEGEVKQHQAGARMRHGGAQRELSRAFASRLATDGLLTIAPTFHTHPAIQRGLSAQLTTLATGTACANSTPLAPFGERVGQLHNVPLVLNANGLH